MTDTDHATLSRRALLGAGGALLTAPALAQAPWPNRPIRLVVPFGPGGSTDVLARLLTEQMAPRLGQPFVLENRPGAGATLGTGVVADAAPDGYTVLLSAISAFSVGSTLYRGRITWDPVRSFAHVGMIQSGYYALMANNAAPFANPGELAAAARARPGIAYATSGVGSLPHLFMLRYCQAANIEMQHIPYRGGAPAVQDLLAGRTAGYFGNPSDMAPFLQSGEVRVIASSGAARSALAPDVPTVAEQGFPGFRFETWNGLLAPRGTPPAAIARLAAAVREACAEEPVRAGLRRLGSDPVCNTTAEFAAQMQAEAPVWRDVVQRSGVRLD